MKRSLVLCAMGLASICAVGCVPHEEGKDAGAKLAQSAPLPPAYPKPRIELSNQKLRQDAINQIRTSTKSQDPFSRAHAMEAAKNLPADLMSEMIAGGLSDQAAVTRFAALVAAGDMRITTVQATATKLVDDPSIGVQTAATYALHRMGDTSHSHAFEKFATDPDRLVRANTAMLLGMLGEPTATRILNYQIRDPDPIVRLQAEGSLWQYKDQQALEFLISATISRYPDDRMIAALALAQPRDPRVVEHLRGMLTTKYTEVNLVAARAMGMLGYDEGYGVAIEGAKSQDARQRQLAAMAFGTIGRMDAQQILGKLLADNDEDVRIAAASALLQLR